MSKIRVLLADDHTIVRKGIRSLLDSLTDIEVVGEAEDGRQAVQMVEQLQPEVVVMDITMPRLNGLEAARQINQRFGRVKVVILSMHRDEQYVWSLLRAGVSGYVVKQAAPTELISAIRAVAGGQTFLSPSISTRLVERCRGTVEASSGPDRYDTLTGREREVLQLIAEGNGNKQIAYQLHISTRTVETHRAHLMEKLDIHSTAELTQYAIRRGLIRPEG